MASDRLKNKINSLWSEASVYPLYRFNPKTMSQAIRDQRGA